MAEMVPLNSSNIAGASYDDDTRELHVMFVSGAEYAYGGVPREVYEGLLAAGSPGKYFAANVCNLHATRKIGG